MSMNLQEYFRNFNVSLITDKSFTVFVKNDDKFETIEEYSEVPEDAFLFASNRINNRLLIELRRYKDNQTLANAALMLRRSDIDEYKLFEYFFKKINSYQTSTNHES